MPRTRSDTATLAAVLLCAAIAAAGCSEDMSAAPTAPSASLDERAGVMLVAIEISPATLVIDSAGTWVTVHAEIPLSEVEPLSVALAGIEPDVVKADNRGDLVAKFTRDSIVAIVSPPEATLELTGLTAEGTAFSGSDAITVQ